MNSLGSTRLATKFTASALSLALAAAVLAWPAPARAEEDVPLDTKIVRGILESLGLRKDGEAINYQERAPLVLPSSRTLPPPERSDAVVANNPAWPKDPDVIKRKKELELEAKPRTTEDMENEARPLRPDQLTPGGNSRSVRRETRVGGESTNPGDRLSPSDLGYKGGMFSNFFGGKAEESAKFTGEPRRTELTQPPPGYRTPSPDQPYGVGKEATQPKKTDYLTEHGTRD
jgi:hypothetical protein